MRIALVLPPSPFLLDDRALPWLGPLYVAACLREKGHQVRILDLAGDPNYLDTAAKDAREIGADCYGLTATAPDYPLALQIREAIRAASPDVRIILGGAHASMSPKLCYDGKGQGVKGWDAVVAGDGFTAVFEALQRDGTISARFRGEILSDVNLVPMPARDLIDLKSYKFNVLGEPATSIFTIWGCANGCLFCSGRDVFSYRVMRWLSPQRVLRELDLIYDTWGFRAYSDYADEWNLNKVKVLERCDALSNHHRKYILRCFAKAEHLDDEIAQAMRQAGVVEVLVGVESGSDRVLNLIHKNTTWEINGAARLAAKRAGIRFKAATMLGLPTETREDILKTKEWLLTFKPDDMDVTVFSPLPGSPIFDRPELHAQGLFIQDGDGKFLPYKTGFGEYRSKVRTETLSAEEIVSLRDEIDRDVRQELGMPMPKRESRHKASMGQASHQLTGGTFR